MNNTQLVVSPQSSEPIDIQSMATQTTEDFFFTTMASGGMSDSGETVNPSTALGHGPVWQAVNILSGDIGQLPFWKMKRSGDLREKDRNAPINYTLGVEPNPYQTPSVWKETMMSYALLWGNAISVIVPAPGGRRWLMPLMPDVTSYEQDERGNYHITTRIANEDRSFDYEDCFHIRGLQSNGFWGLSAIDVARNVLGHGLALQKHGNKTFKNDAKPSGVLRTDQPFNPEAHKNLREEWYKTQGGDNRRSIAILWEGLEFKPMSMSNEDAQWLEARKLDREFVASLFNLPAFKLNALENSAVRANLEEQNRDYFQTSLSRWMNRFVEEARRKLLPPQLRSSGDHYFRWFPEAFLRGDVKMRMESYSLAIASRILSPNEARAKEDMDPYEGGDEYLNPAIEQSPKLDDQKSKLRSIISNQLEGALLVESNKVERASKVTKDFLSWVQKFYSSAEGLAAIFGERLSEPCELARLLGMEVEWEIACATHMAENCQSFENICELTDKKDIALAVKDKAEEIRLQCKQLTKSIFKE